MRKPMILGAFAACALGLGVLSATAPAQAQWVYNSEGAYSGRYTRDYDYAPHGRYDDDDDDEVSVEWDAGGTRYRSVDEPAWAHTAYGCSDNQGGGRYFKCRLR